MLYIHPAIMAMLIILCLYVARLGFIRLSVRRMGRKGVFPWKRHVLLGKVALLGLLLGMGSGLTMTWLLWGDPFSTGLHFLGALGMLPLILFGIATGLLLDHKRAATVSRTVGPNHYVGSSRVAGAGRAMLDRLGARLGGQLPLVHALGNGLLLLLALCQIWTGIGVLRG